MGFKYRPDLKEIHYLKPFVEMVKDGQMPRPKEWEESALKLQREMEVTRTLRIVVGTIMVLVVICLFIFI